MTHSSKQSSSIFKSFHWRELLQGFYDWKKRLVKVFSRCLFSVDAIITSTNYHLRVLKTECNHSEQYSKRICSSKSLPNNEAGHGYVKFSNEFNVVKFSFSSKWYYLVIRGLSIITNFGNDYNLLSRNCIPQITQQAQDSINCTYQINIKRGNLAIYILST